LEVGLQHGYVHAPCWPTSPTHLPTSKWQVILQFKASRLIHSRICHPRQTYSLSQRHTAKSSQQMLRVGHGSHCRKEGRVRRLLPFCTNAEAWGCNQSITAYGQLPLATLGPRCCEVGNVDPSEGIGSGVALSVGLGLSLADYYQG